MNLIPDSVPVLIHTAFHGFKREGWTAERLIGMFLDRGGPVLMPAFNWKVREFHTDNTPSRVGYVSELFRTKYATRRSQHPTHSICGVRADELLGIHDTETPCPLMSPIGRLPLLGGWVVMAGVGFDCCTLIHHVEEMIAPTIYLDEPSDYMMNGKCVTMRTYKKLPRDYWKVQDALAPVIRSTHMGTVSLMAFPAMEAYEVVSRMLMDNPLCLMQSSRYRIM